MQVHIVKQMPSVKAEYIDPQAIAQTNFNYPRQSKLRQESLKVLAYIALALKNLQ